MAIKESKSLAAITQARNEVHILTHLSHPNIIKLIKSYECDSVHSIVYEYADKGDLYSLLSSGPLNVDLQINIFSQLVSAVSYIHEQGYTHRDIKIDNVLLFSANPYPRVVLSDFGLAHSACYTEVVKRGSPEYVAPEIFYESSVSYIKVDCFALYVS